MRVLPVRAGGNQTDSAVVARSIDYEEFLQIWQDNHRDRILRIVIPSEYDEVSGHLMVHHQRS